MTILIITAIIIGMIFLTALGLIDFLILAATAALATRAKDAGAEEPRSARPPGAAERARRPLAPGAARGSEPDAHGRRLPPGRRGTRASSPGPASRRGPRGRDGGARAAGRPGGRARAASLRTAPGRRN